MNNTTTEKKLPIFSGAIAEQRLPADTLARYPANRQPSAEAIEAMRLSILENGQLQPITVRPTTQHAGKKYEIIFGETRAQAALKIAPDFLIRAYVLELDDAEAARIHAVENFQRKQLDPLEEAEAMENMRKNGWEIKSIAATLDLGRNTVHRRLQLLKLSSKAKAALKSEKLPLRTAELIAGLEEDEYEKALQLVIEPTHSAEPLSHERAVEEINVKIIRPRERKTEWETRRKELCAAFPDSDFLDYAESEEKNHWSSGFVDCSAFPDMGIRSPKAKSFDLIIPTWGELAEKHGAKTWICCPNQPLDGSDVRIIVEAQPLIEAELLAYKEEIENCVFAHPKQLKTSTRDEQAALRKKADEEYRASLKKEITAALTYLARPEAVLPKAAEDVCVEVFKEFVEDFEFKGAALPGFENPTEEEILANGAKYLRAKEFGGFAALGRLYIVAKLDMPPGPYTEKLLGRMLIGTKAVRKEDFPMLAKAWSEHCAEQLKQDEAELESLPVLPI